MPLYTLIFLTECNCMYEEAFKFIEEHGSYYLIEEGIHIRMHGASRAPSLLPKYTTDYVLHKEAIRKVYIDGVGIFLFEHKKESYPAIPFVRVHRVLPKERTPRTTTSHKQITDQYTNVCHVVKTIKRETVHSPS